MKRLVGAVLRGVALGSGGGLLLGAVANVFVAVRSWPGRDAQPSERARAIAEGIAEGMHVGLFAAVVLSVVAIGYFVWRGR